MSDTDSEDEDGEVDDPDELPSHIDYSGDVTPVIGGDPPDWFTDADAQILFILMTGLTLTPSIIAENTEYSRQTISKRLNTLQAADFVEKVARGKYEITSEGAFVVTGDSDIYRENADAESEEEESKE